MECFEGWCEFYPAMPDAHGTPRSRLPIGMGLHSSIMRLFAEGVFARLVPARVFKTRGGCEQRSQSVRFRYTPVQVRARRRNDQHLSAQNPSPKDLLIFLHRMASPRHLLLHRMMSTLRHYNLHPRRRTR